jgi:uncharacterized protein YndB with AHSA1/START domain
MAPTIRNDVIHSTFVIERSYPASPARVFAAFADREKKRRWFVESHGNEVEHYDLDFREGGREVARFRFTHDPVNGLVCTNETTYADVVPERRIVFASAMTIGGRRISVSLVTAEFLVTPAGTDLVLTHQGVFFEGADGPEMREAGWRKLADRLADFLGD